MLLNLLCFSLLTSGSSLGALLCDSWLEMKNLVVFFPYIYPPQPLPNVDFVNFHYSYYYRP